MKVFQRTINLIGEENFKKIQKTRVLLIGIGGVGGYVAEGLIRAGVSNLTIIDNDIVSESNLNRQIIALTTTIGKDKVEVAKERFLQINPKAKITAIKSFISPENIEDIDFSKFDYVIDAIDFVPGKIAVIEKAKENNVKIISCMGTGNKLHPEKFEIVDISKTSVCPLAKKIRQELNKKGIKNVTVLYSKEEPVNNNTNENGKIVPNSISTVPSIAGLLIANYTLLDIIKKN